jgi:type I restriction enzyme S subunit
MGEVIQLDEETAKFALGQRIVCMRGKEKKLDNTFLRYLLTSPPQRDLLASYATGTTVLGISQKALRSMPISIPCFDEQQEIGRILVALDDKIELNKRMNETLEGTARTIFKDWFVDFGPTRAKMEGREPYLASALFALFPDRIDDETSLPEGWEHSTVGEDFNLTMGQSPPGETYNENGAGLPFFQGRTDFGFRYPDNRKYCTAPTRVAEADDTLVSVRAPVGDLNMAWERCCIGRGVAAIRHRSGSRSYTYYILQSIQGDLQAYEHTGTVFGAINKNQFEAIRIVRPRPELAGAFESLAEPIDQRIKANIVEARTLEQTRVLILPKLMSGEIRLRDAESTTGGAL